MRSILPPSHESTIRYFHAALVGGAWSAVAMTDPDATTSSKKTKARTSPVGSSP
jgi:hypothetical protein